MKNLSSLNSFPWFFLLLAGLLGALPVYSQSNGTSTQQVTAVIAGRYISVYETILNIKLDAASRERMMKALQGYEAAGNNEAVQRVLTDAAYYGKDEELGSLRVSSLVTIVESMRRSTDPALMILLAAFDKAHPDMKTATQARGFADIVGMWKRTDGLIADKGPGGNAMGVSYTTSDMLEVKSDGSYRRVQIHDHYSGSCRNMEAVTESGTLSIAGNMLQFNVRSGTKVIQDNCQPALNRRDKIPSRKEQFPWSVRPGVNDPSVLMLCWNTDSTSALCFEKIR